MQSIRPSHSNFKNFPLVKPDNKKAAKKPKKSPSVLRIIGTSQDPTCNKTKTKNKKG